MISECMLSNMESVSNYDILFHRYEARIDELLMKSTDCYINGVIAIQFWCNNGTDLCPPDSSLLRDILEKYISSWGDIGAFMVREENNIDSIYIIFKSSMINEKVSVKDASELGTLIRVIY